MTPRSPHEPHRAATPLELFFDLVFVVAISQAAGSLHHAIGEAHFAHGVGGYMLVFFAIWWAWMNFTWFASAYDNDDIAYRIAVFVQLTGSLVLAAGIGRAFDGDYRIATIGYAVTRIALVAQWLRAAASTRDGDRRCALRYAAGVATLQVGWIALNFAAPESWKTIGFAMLIAGELLVPVWAERAGATSWHGGHITERYGLFTIIVLGESVLAGLVAIQAATQAGGLPAPLVSIIVGGLLIVFSMWWYYFDWPAEELLTSLRRAFVWGYGHYFIFAAAGAVGAGLAVAVDQATGASHIGASAAGAAVAIPVAAYTAALWVAHALPRREPLPIRILGPVAALLVLLTPLAGHHAVLLTGVVLTTVLAVKLALRRRAATPE